MGELVVDASAAVAWFLEDESAPQADDALDNVLSDGGFVTQHWRFEVCNALLRAERRGRASADEVSTHLLRLSELRIEIDAEINLEAVFTLARAHGLSFYDAAYLELAKRRDIPLITLDNALDRAASAEGLPALP